MGNINKKKFAIWAAVILVLVIGVWQLLKTVTYAEPITAEEAAGHVKEMYKGEIVDVMEDDSSFKITIKLATGIYQVEVDRKTGDINSMTRSKVGKTGEIVNGNEGEVKEPSTPTHEEPKHQENPEQPKNIQEETPIQPAKRITEAEAAAIALQNINGEVDDIEIESNGDITYYLVEIEREEESDGIVQINAITGEVMSITWED